ncbi:MAG: histidine kinase dimerization/phosphoacceptor domain-containing protein [Chloroflexota bacterium]
MKRTEHRGSTLIGFLVIGVVAARTLIFYWDTPHRVLVIALLGWYALSYGLESRLSKRLAWFYFPLQTALVIVLSNLRPFQDFQTLLFIPLGVQALRAFSRRAALVWMLVYAVLVGVTEVIGLGLADGLAFFLLYLAVSAFLVSYDLLYARTQADEAESQRLLADLQDAHAKLQDYAAQAEELAAARERNRLARELHDSVSQAIFSITLTSQSTRLLLERDPARVPEQVDRLQTMTEGALAQLRSLIAQLRPPQNS